MVRNSLALMALTTVLASSGASLGACSAPATPRQAVPVKPPAAAAAPEQGTISRTVQDRAGKAYLGISVREDDGSLLVLEVLEDSPAAKASMRAGDRLQSIDGHPVNNLQDLDRVMARLRPGQEVRISILRGERSRRLRVSLGGEAAGGKRSEAESQAVREGLERERAAAEADLHLARLEAERQLRAARSEVEEVRAKIKAEQERARKEIEAQRHKARVEMARERQSFEDEVQGERRRAEAESKDLQRDMENQRRNLQLELSKAQQQVESELRRAHEDMAREREDFERRLRQERREAEEEMQRVHWDMDLEREALGKEMEKARRKADEDIVLQHERVAKQLTLAREEMDRARRKMSRSAPARVSRGSGTRAGGSPDVGRELGGLRGEIERIREGLRELKSLLERKR